MTTPDEQAELRTNQLYGRVLTVIAWVETERRPWSSAEKRDAEGSVRAAENWIVRQASKWGVEVCFVTDAQQDFVVRLQELPAGYDSGESRSVAEWIELISPIASWVSPGAFLTQLQTDLGVDHAHLLLLVPRNGRAYAAQNSNGRDEWDALSVAACFFDRRRGGVSPATVAHELLHLYGAWDLYESPHNCREQSDHAERLFAGDIMLTTSSHIKELAIKDLTAWRLGWRGMGPAWFEYFAPVYGDPNLLQLREPPPRAFAPTRTVGRGQIATGLRWCASLARQCLGAWRNGRKLEGQSAGSIRQDPPKSHPPKKPGAKRTAGTRGRNPRPRLPTKQLLFSYEKLLSHDPILPATFDTFSDAMYEVLRQHSMVEATEIAAVQPPRGRGAQSQCHFGELMVEWETIRRLVAAHHGWVAQEAQLRNRVEEWKRLIDRAAESSGRADLAPIRDVHRTSVLILDSIQRRDIQAVKDAVLRYRHFERQMR